MKTTFHKKGVCLYLVFLIASLVFSSFYGGAVSFVWLYALILLIPVSFFYILINYKFLSIYQTMDVHKVLKGDPISAINWKISAKFGDLVVRLKKEKRTLTMILEAANIPEIKWDTQFLKDRDRFLELIVSCAFNFAGQGVPIKLIYPSGTVTEKMVDSYESFLEFYNTVADGIIYSTDSEVSKLKEMISSRSDVYGDETIILIKEQIQSGEDYCTVIG